MNHRSIKRPLLLAAVLSSLCAVPAWADKPEWAGHGKPSHAAGKHGESGGHGFSDEARRTIDDYYGERARAGKCPPGLAKKHNGCLPPGQAKKWAMGRPLPPDVVVVDLPRDLRLRLPAPPPQHKYVRVAQDILLVAVGTSMVIDAIEDIGRISGK